MIRHRTDGQVVESARQIQEALGDLSEEQMVALVAARHAWTVRGQLDPTTICPALIEAVRAPAAVEWDAIFTRRARAELVGLAT